MCGMILTVIPKVRHSESRHYNHLIITLHSPHPGQDHWWKRHQWPVGQSWSEEKVVGIQTCCTKCQSCFLKCESEGSSYTCHCRCRTGCNCRSDYHVFGSNKSKYIKAEAYKTDFRNTEPSEYRIFEISSSDQQPFWPFWQHGEVFVHL